MNLFKRQQSANQIQIQVELIQIKPLRYFKLQQFLLDLEFEYLTHEYLHKRKSELDFQVYEFQITYGQLSWTIRRTVKEFQSLEKGVRNDAFYRFRTKAINTERADESPEEVLIRLDLYLQKLLKFNQVSDCLLRFLEISYIQFGSNVQKYKEAYFMKKAGGRYGESKCARCGTFWGKWDKRYLIITSEGVLYTKGPQKDNCQIREVLSYDYNFTVTHGLIDTGHERTIVIECTSRKLVLMATNLRQFYDFLYCLQEAMKNSLYTKLHRFDSFAPIRQSLCKSYIDGEGYFSDVCDAIRKAKHSIYITDWWLSPEFYLKRPISITEVDLTNANTRIDRLLKTMADEGVQVLILVYQEPTMALNNDSLHTKQYLESLSPNIKVLRHPQQIIPMLYSHHEKMVVIDNKVGFMGGLDLCFGRMDTQKHHLFEPNEDSSSKYWPGIDFSNSRVKDFFNVKQTEHQLIPNDCPRMPWHDIALRLTGETVKDMTRHFVQYWNYVTIGQQFQKRNNQLIHNISQNAEENLYDYHPLEDKPQHKIKRDSFNQFEDGHFTAYMNELERQSAIQQKKGINQNDQLHPFEIKVTTSCEVEMEMEASNKIRKQEIKNNNTPPVAASQNLSERSKNRSEKLFTSITNKPVAPDFMKMIKQLQSTKFQEDEKYYTRMKKITHNDSSQIPDTFMLEQPQLQQKNSTLENQNQIIAKPLVNLSFSNYNSNDQTQITQMIRSASNWSIGVKNINKEFSIQVAYLHLISEAKHFIYIENQFFISSTAGYPVQNQVANALISRIKQAFDLKQQFKVIVFLPLLPGFEGQIDDPASGVLRVQLHWEYFTISRGGQSIIEQLRNYNIIPEDYIEFYSLRQHGGPIATTEIIYIHSKLMIVDDEVVLIGSANINDRSLMGSRDSEIAMVIQDQSLIEIKMNGQPFQANSFAHTLRTNIFMEHFGMKYEDVMDPLDDTLQQRMREQSKTNTAIYREIFACYPDDNVHTLEQYKEFKERKNLSLYPEMMKGVIGHAVQFPLHFMENENLRFSVFQKEYFCPDINFT